MVKTYGWLSQEKLKFINDNPKVVSLLYDLGLLPEEISARVRGYVEEETAKLNLQNSEMRALLVRWNDAWKVAAIVDSGHTHTDVALINAQTELFLEATVIEKRVEQGQKCGKEHAGGGVFCGHYAGHGGRHVAIVQGEQVTWAELQS